MSLTGALVLANALQRRIAALGAAGFLIMLGPTMFLVTTATSAFHSLYLYTPHFFLALMVGALFGQRIAASALAVVVAALIVAPPLRSGLRDNVRTFYLEKGAAERALFDAAVARLTPLPAGTAVFIAGVVPYQHPFWTQPGNSLKIAFKDSDLAVIVERPEPELTEKFCATSGSRRFLKFEGTRATDVTSEMEKRCVSLAAR
jgi:hypothetical protein